MAFKSWKSFDDFSRAVRHGQRYFHKAEVYEFLTEVKNTCSDRYRKIPKDYYFYRAQHGNDWDKDIHDGEVVWAGECPHDKERMLPRRYKANEGRVNPKGISYLYMATDRDTAMSEVRPWIGSKVSLAILKTFSELTVIDCSVNHEPNTIFHFKEPTDPEKEKAVWSMLDRAFSQPVSTDDSTPDYVPTQIIAEMFKDIGLDGIMYKSLLGQGYSVVLFDINATTFERCELYEAKSVKFQFSECANPHFYNQKDNDTL